jgi:hypothetical protein
VLQTVLLQGFYIILQPLLAASTTTAMPMIAKSGILRQTQLQQGHQHSSFGESNHFMLKSVKFRVYIFI